MAQSRLHLQYQDVRVHLFRITNLLRIDWMLPLTMIALAVIGWLLMYSAARSTDIAYFHRQIIFFFVGLLLAIFVISVDLRILVALGPLFYAGAVILLILVVFFGTAVKGSERWIVLGPFRLQPSELCKLTMVYMLAWYFSRLGNRIRKIHWFLLTFVIAALPIALILKQPNMGTAVSLAPLTVVMLYVAGCRKRHLIVLCLLALSVVPALWWQMRDFDPEVPTESRAFYELRHYQKMRIYAYLHPDYDPKGSGWHTIQSRITVGSGGLTGKGYLKGTQTRLNYLPEHHTDFIYSLLAEEFGFVGVTAVIALYVVFLLRGLMFARDCPHMPGTLVAAGVVAIFSFHIFVNIAITTGLLPVTGIPLPFLSYGGSFYMTAMAGTGALLSVPLQGKKRFHQETVSAYTPPRKPAYVIKARAGEA